tara:strand:+ start:695 stop:1453 length:759 start_codon:yes stop_codon:yes gene_type:complete
MELIDTHCHIYYENFNNDINQVIERAKKNNISKIVCVGVDIESSMQSIRLAEEHSMIYATAGYHPHESKDTSASYLKELENILQHEKVIALGEIGLDFHYNHSDKKTQIKVFKEQLELAKTLDVPTIVHCRNSDTDLIQCIKETKSRNGVVHCFASNIDFAKELFRIGYYISFTGLVTFSKDLINVVKEIPLDKFMLETDSPYLTPIPHRGKRNEPSMIKYIAESIAEIKNVELKTIAESTTKTAKEFFDFR